MNKITVIVLFNLWMPIQAFATLNLKKVQVIDPFQIELQFDGKVTADQLKTDFLNDIIQLSFSDAAVYPAKISNVHQSDVLKIFAYQYSPKLIRCRLSVKGKALDYQDRMKIKIDGRNVRLRFIDRAHQVLAREIKQPLTVDTLRVSAASPLKQAPIINDDLDSKLQDGEREILDRVLKSANETKLEGSMGSDKSKEKTSRLIRPLKTFGVLAFVISLFVIMAFSFKKLVLDKNTTKKGLTKFLGSFKQAGKKNKIIEHVATHYLGPKKSIAVVKIAGKLLVLGITPEHINLISQLNSENDLDHDFLLDAADGLGIDKPESVQGIGAVSAGQATFSNFLSQENQKPSFTNKIKRRLEGMKEL